MSRNLEPISSGANMRRKVVSAEPEDEGWRVVMECGHTSWWAVAPPPTEGYCSQCLDVAIEKLRQGGR